MKDGFLQITQSLENWLNKDNIVNPTPQLQNYFQLAYANSPDFQALNMETNPVSFAGYSEVLDNDRWPELILSGLKNYYEFIFLFESYKSETWYLSSLSIRGQNFKLNIVEQISAKNLMPPKISENDIYKISSQKLLRYFEVEADSTDEDDPCFLMRPVRNVSIALGTKLPAPWIPNQIEMTQKLVNQAFSY